MRRWSLRSRMPDRSARRPNLVLRIVARATLGVAALVKDAAERLNGWAEDVVIRRSAAFDEAWYLERNPDVAEQGCDPARHFREHGVAEGRDPSAAFPLNAVLAPPGVNPVVWHELYASPRQKGRVRDWVALTRASPLFSAVWYRDVYPDIARAGMDPAWHYAQYGWREGRNPGPRFNTAFYVEQMPENERGVRFPLEHYETEGRALGLTPCGIPAPIAEALPTGPLRAPSDLGGRFRIGVAAHVFYPEMAEDIAAAVARIPDDVILMASTDTPEKAEAVRAVFARLPNLAELAIEVVPNRGRDVAPMLVAFADRIAACDLILHLHSKRSPYGAKLAGWFEHCVDHLAHSPLYVEMILRAFAEDETLGVVCAPPFPPVIPFMTWAGMRADARRMLRRMQMEPGVLDAFPLDFPSSTMMWFRPKALAQFFATPWSWTDFPEEAGQTDRTTAHVFERLVFYVAHANGYGRIAHRPAEDGEGFALRLLDPPAAPIALPACAEPDVSIVIPVYNQWDVTAACLRAIVEHTDPDATPYEVILADDASTDATATEAARWPNLRVVRGEGNVGFLLNANRGAAAARGKRLALLNNDTQVQPGWLDALTDTLERHPDAAIAGAKLLYPDGVLQEAGGIVWADAGGLNYGRNDPQPLRPEYCYLRETDYISGAAILVDGAFWRERGGFDPLFAPAYYEDTDLCFAARAQGRKTLFDPGALVAHFEGKSHGTDLSSGVKKHQVINRARFLEKWRDALARDHRADIGLARARERSGGRKVIALIDWEVPEYDRHAGGRYVWDYLNLMVERGYVVKFLACHLGAARHLRIAAELRRLGVETFLPDGFLEMRDWRDWIGANAGYLDAVILSRPNVAERHQQTCRDAGVPNLYLCHDLHGLRTLREAETRDDPALKAEAAAMSAHERKIIAAADFTFTPSAFEEELIRTSYNVSKVGVLPLHVLRAPPVPRDAAPQGADLLFVGGMAHGPNPDAVEWFLDEIWPRIAARRPDARLHVVGADAPRHLLARADERVLFHGALNEDELAALYAQARAAIAPLRFGAGVKGKVLEAMRRGTPVIGTTVALEGVPELETAALKADAADAFADHAMQVLTMPGPRWLELSRRQQAFVAERFDADACHGRLEDGLRHPTTVPQDANVSSHPLTAPPGAEHHQ